MRAFIAAIILLSFLVGAAFLTGRALKQEAEGLLSQAEELESVSEGERGEAAQAVNSAWKKKKFGFSMTISHSEIDILEGVLARLEAAAKASDGDDFLIAVAELSASLSHLRDLCAFSLDNIL